MKKYLINYNDTIHNAIKKIDINGKRSLVVVKNKKLFGTISDGDIRKILLKDISLKNKISRYVNIKPIKIKKSIYYKKKAEDYFKKKTDLSLIPIVDRFNNILNVFTVNNLKKKINVAVVIVAGGVGKRLRPFTHILPKPLMPINNKSILEIIVEKFFENGSKKIFLSLKYKAELIKSYIKTAENKCLKNIKIFVEKDYSGTIGCLKLMEKQLPKVFFVVNCDVIHDVDLNDFYNYHKKNYYDLTLHSCLKKFTIPYGICKINTDGLLDSILEKPTYEHHINTGLYILNKDLINLIPKNKKYDFTDLIILAKKCKKRIGIYKSINNKWHDLGNWESLRSTLNSYL
jgi:dTDP-glucose pyrophosphorylase